MNPVPARLCAVLALALLAPLADARSPAGAALTPVAAAVAPAPTSAVRWRLDVARLRGAEVVAAHAVGGLLLVEDADHGVTALDPGSGRVAWFVQLRAALEPAPLAGLGFVVLSTAEQVVALRLDSGQRVGQLDQLAPSAAAPQTDGELVYLTSLRGDDVLAQQLDGGQLAWSFAMPATVRSLAWIDVPGAEGLLLHDAGGSLRALPDGAAVPTHQTWTLRVGRLAGDPVLAGRQVLVATADQVLMSVDAGSGRLRWRVAGAHRLTGSPVVVGDVVVVGREGGVSGLSLKDGRRLWDVDGAAVPRGALAGGRVLVQADVGYLVLDAANGEFLRGGGKQALAVGGWLVGWSADTVEGR